MNRSPPSSSSSFSSNPRHKTGSISKSLPLRHVLLLTIGFGITATVAAILRAFGYQDMRQASAPLLILPPLTHSTTNFTLPPLNRTLLLVHIGKAGGITLKETLKRWSEEEALQPLYLNPKSFHVWAYFEKHLQEATTFIVPLRNPVHRIISSYRYNHEENCTPEWFLKGKTGHRAPGGCHIKAQREKDAQTGKTSKLVLWANKVFQECFPSPAMEAFAQSVMSPWYNHHLNQSFTLAKQRDCQKMARDMVQGNLLKQLASPHMEFNYQYYAQRTLWTYNSTQKEIIAIRLEHSQQDLNAVREALAHSVGRKAPPTNITTISHGSETYLPSPLTTEAYHKLCCVLQAEIQTYQEFLQRSINLSPQQQQESIQMVYDQCGIENWEEWRTDCQTKLNKDGNELQEFAAAAAAAKEKKG
jgi:hypothetical protein